MKFPRMIRVEAEMDQMGNISVKPSDVKYARTFSEVRKSNGGGDGLDCFFQEGMGASEFLKEHIPQDLHEDLEQGWSIDFKVDPWVVGHWYGYDAHTACE